jgi:predicted transcriptional regulator
MKIRRIRSVDKAISILKYLADNEGVTLEDISLSLDLPKGTVACHLATLGDHGFVKKTGESYDLGMGVALLWACVKERKENKRNDLLYRVKEIDKDIKKLDGKYPEKEDKKQWVNSYNHKSHNPRKTMLLAQQLFSNNN